MTTRTRRFALVALIAACMAARTNPAGVQASAPSSPVAPGTPLGACPTSAPLPLMLLQLVRNDDLKAAKARVEGLEVQWRRDQTSMKPLFHKRNERIDEAIDRVERELRFSRVRRTDSAAALEALIATMDSERSAPSRATGD